MKKWVVIAATVVLQICLGGILGWSVFVPSLQADYSLTAGQTGFIFGLYIALFTLGTVLGGRIQEARGCRPTALLGALLVASGWTLSAQSGGSFPLLLLGTGLLTGLGNGFCYIGTLVACVKWFPNAPGRATGAAVVGTGGGAILLTAIAELMLRDGYGILSVFQRLAIVYGSVMFACAALLFVPPADAIPVRQRVPLAHLLTTRHFWALGLALFGSTFGALMVIGHLKPIGLDAYHPAQTAALAVALFAVGNAIGRLGWGVIYDHLGRRAILLSLVALLVGILTLLAAGSLPVFLLSTVWLGASFGATMVVYASDVAITWGHDRVGSVYPVIYLAYGLAGITSPGTGGWIKDATDSYLFPILLAAAIVACGTLAYWTLTRPAK